MKCELCGSGRRDTIRYGEFLSKNGKGVHTNCLYLSSGLNQNGPEDEGFLGFLPKDIAAERARVSKTQCCYCRKLYANIGCCEVRCHRNFHMICGIECGAMNQFLDTFRSFCDRHLRKVPTRPKPDEECCICYEKIFIESRRFSSATMIRAPCCRNGWFHKYCLQKFAKNAGYFFKCPLCNDSQKFRASMSYWGVFVQEKDAEWELVPNAYAELLERPNVCGAKICHSVEGRGQSTDTNPFLYCVTCGSMAIHRHCVPHRGNSFECDTCQGILNSDSGHESLSSQQQYVDNENERAEAVNEDENSDVDVCEDSDEKLARQTEEVVSDEEILPPKMKNKNALRILDETEETSCSADENISLVAHITENSIADTVELNCSKDIQLSSTGDEADYSEDEALVDAFESPEMPHSSREKNNIGINEKISNTGREQRTENNILTKSKQQDCRLNTSFITQRTRRKSLGVRPPVVEESADGASSSSSFQSSRPYQVFQYDDEDDSATQSADEGQLQSTEDDKLSSSSYIKNEIGDHDESKAYTGQGLLDYFYALLLEVKKGKAVDCANTKDEKIIDVNSEQPSCNSGQRREFDRGATREMVKNVATCALDISCIANRTRRRSLATAQNKPSPTTSVAYEESVDEEELSTKSSLWEPAKYERRNSSNVNCIAKRTRKRWNSSDDTEEDNVLEVPKDCTDKKDEKMIDAKADQHSSNCEQRCILDKEVTEIHENIENEAINSLDVSCIANRTRRRSSLKLQSTRNRTQSVDHEENHLVDTVCTVSADSVVSYRPETDELVEIQMLDKSCIAKRTRCKSVSLNTWQNIIANKSIASSYPNESASTSKSSRSSTESFKSSTYFGRSYEYANENYDDSNCQASENSHKTNAIPTLPPASTSTSHYRAAAKLSTEMAQKRKIHFDSPMPPKIPALSEDESEPDSHANALDQSCIANRTRRRSADVIKLKHLASVEESKETFTTNAKEQEASSATMFLSDSCPEDKSSDSTIITTQSTQTTTSDTLSSLRIRRGQRTRIRPRRFLEYESDSDSTQTSILHSPIPNKISWPNLEEKNDPYIMPKYTRFNGKLKRISTDSFQMQRQRQTTTCQTLDAQQHFARSYNLLLQTPNNNHRRTSSSRT